MTECEDLVAKVEACVAGHDDWRTFADAALAVLTYLFVPPLKMPRVEYDTATDSGVDRRDAIFPNRMLDPAGSWSVLRIDLDAKLIVVDFKNYAPDKAAVVTTLDYVKPEFGRLAIICSRERPLRSALIKQKANYRSAGKLVIFLSVEELREMCARKERGDDPADLIVDLVEDFFIRLD